MRRDQLEHLVRAASAVTKEDTFVIIGSQAILASFPDAPDPLLRSLEADVYPLDDPDKADLIDGALGDGSTFHEQFGFYAHGVGPETAKAPAGWEERLVRIEVPTPYGPQAEALALCLEQHDLVLAKCARGEKRDWEFADAALAAGLVELSVLIERVETMPLAEAARDLLRSMLEAAPTRIERGY